MELSVKARQTKPTIGFGRPTLHKDLVSSGLKQSPLGAAKLWTRLRATQKRGELFATGVLVICGTVLSGLLFIANLSDRLPTKAS